MILYFQAPAMVKNAAHVKGSLVLPCMVVLKQWHMHAHLCNSLAHELLLQKCRVTFSLSLDVSCQWPRFVSSAGNRASMMLLLLRLDRILSRFEFDRSLVDV